MTCRNAEEGEIDRGRRIICGTAADCYEDAITELKAAMRDAV